MLKDIEFVVEPSRAGFRLDKILLDRCRSATRAQVLDAVVRGAVLLNGRAAAKGVKVRMGDVIQIIEMAESADLRVRPQPELPLAVVYEDSDLLALDKPAGQPVHPLDYRESGTLLNAVIGRYRELQRVGDDPLLPAVVHRIDADTSGLVLAAKNGRAYECLRDQFRAKTVKKIYFAVVRGEVEQPGRVESRLVHHESPGGHKMIALGDRPAPRGQKPMRAVTEYEPVEKVMGLTLLRVTIFTGVTHQIRCQLADAGFPIVGDEIYGIEKGALPRQYLHAAEITIDHPADGRELTIRSELPREFRDLMGTRPAEDDRG